MTWTAADIDRVKALVNDSYSSRDIAAILGVSKHKVLTVAKQEGWTWKRSGPEPMVIPAPDDFAERYASMSQNALGRHYRVCHRTVARWIDSAGLARKPSTTNVHRREIPDSFERQWAVQSQANLALYYRTTVKIIRRWEREKGLKRDQNALLRKPTIAKPNAYQTTPVDRIQRDMTVAGQAADFLRRFGAVWRCDPSGRPNPSGSHYRRGSAVLTPDEIIARAERQGWERDAWRRIAA